MKNLIFIGGIHGVGKGYLCKKIVEKTNLIHLSSSDLIKWTEISSKENKKVANIDNSQKRLIHGLNQTIKNGEKYLLDGHFCLWDSSNYPVEVPFDTFKKIEPRGIILITENIDLILKRLNVRDNTSYQKSSLQILQEKEEERAFEIAEKLGVELILFQNNFDEIIKFINEKL